MFLRVLAVTGTCFGIGALFMLGQRRSGSRTTAWGKYATYALFVLIMLSVAAAGRAVFAVAISLMLSAALYEFNRAARLNLIATIALTVTGLTVATAALFGGHAALYPIVVGAALATLAIGALAPGEHAPGSAAIWGVAGLIAVAATGAHLQLLAGHPQRFALFTFLFLVVCGADAFAELGGRRWPVRRGILPSSPNKTLGGLITGLVAALIIATALNSVLEIWSVIAAAGYGVVLAIAGSVGDLIASSMKRALGIKDFSSALPLHGGVLDRFDSLIFAAVPFYWIAGGLP